MAEPDSAPNVPPLQLVLKKLSDLPVTAGSVAGVAAGLLSAFGFHVPVDVITQYFVRVGVPLICLTTAWDALDHLGARIVQSGKAWWPISFWTVSTGKLGHTPEELSSTSVMLIVPFSREEQAEELRDKLRGASLRFHYLPPPSQATEDGRSGPGDAANRRLSQLPRDLAQCSGLVLLDDGEWGHYPKTLQALRRWGDKYPTRPIVAVRFENTPQSNELAYSWFDYEKIVGPEPLLQGLMTQSAKRGAEWAGLQRTTHHLMRVGFAFALLVGVGTMLFGDWRGWFILRQAQAAMHIRTIFSPELRDVSENVADHKLVLRTPDPASVHTLLSDYATYLKNVLPGHPDAVLFAVFQRGRDRFVREVAASRLWSGYPPELHIGENSAEGVAACAYVTGRTVYWNGATEGHLETHYWKTWSITGDSPDSTSREVIQVGRTVCRFSEENANGQPTTKGDPINELLCSPVGIRKGADPTGVVCVYRAGSGETLTPPLIRAQMLLVANLANFVEWRTADIFSTAARLQAAP